MLACYVLSFVCEMSSFIFHSAIRGTQHTHKNLLGELKKSVGGCRKLRVRAAGEAGHGLLSIKGGKQLLGGGVFKDKGSECHDQPEGHIKILFLLHHFEHTHGNAQGNILILMRAKQNGITSGDREGWSRILERREGMMVAYLMKTVARACLSGVRSLSHVSFAVSTTWLFLVSRSFLPASYLKRLEMALRASIWLFCVAFDEVSPETRRQPANRSSSTKLARLE